MRARLKVALIAVLAAASWSAAPAGAAARMSCTISLAVDDFTVSIGRIDFTLGYPLGVTMVGKGSAVACSSLAVDFGGQPVAGTFVDDDAAVVSGSLVSETGFPGLGALAICSFLADAEPIAESFPIAVQSALSPAGLPIVPVPQVIVTSVDCSETPPTTTLDTTTTTVTTTTVSSTSTTTVTTTTLAPGPSCGDPDGSGGGPTATDSLYVLAVSVGLQICTLQVCDVDASGSITASDALRVLRVAVGLPVPLDCPA